MRTLKEYCNSRYGALKNERSEWDTAYKEISENISPTTGRFQASDRNKIQKNRLNSIINNAGTMARRTLASGMMSGNTNPTRPWFRLTMSDSELTEWGPVKEWLAQVERLFREIYQRSNLYNGLHTAYGELGTYGTDSIAILEDFDNVLRAVPFTVGSYAVAVNNKGTPDVFYREFEFTVAQTVEMFGRKNISTTVKSLYSNRQYDSAVTIRHAVEPNTEQDSDFADNTLMPIRSVYWEPGGDEDMILLQSGYNEHPVLTSRWDVLGMDSYGTGPGWHAVGDVKQLQAEERDTSAAIEKMVNPPMGAPAALKNHAKTTVPGGVTYFDANGPDNRFSPLYQINPRLNEILMDKQAIQQRISRAFHEDLFLMLAQSDRREITAREVDERHEEKLLQLGPVLSRQNAEKFDPLIDRTFAICERAGILPDPPPEIEGLEINVEYISIMAQAQKLVETAGIERLAGYVGNLAGVKPEVLDKMDFDQSVDRYADALGTAPDLVVPDEEVKAIREQRERAMAAQQAMGMASEGAQAAKLLSETDTKQRNALTDSLGL